MKESYGLISLMKINAKIYNKILAHQVQKASEKSFTQSKWDLPLLCRNRSTLCNPINVIWLLFFGLLMWYKVISIDEKKHRIKIQCHFKLKTLSKLVIVG